MKDSILLLLTASFVSMLSWAFWHHLAGKNAFMFVIFVMTTLIADNIRLRRKLKKG